MLQTCIAIALLKIESQLCVLEKNVLFIFLHRTNNAGPTFFNAAVVVLFHLGSGGRFEGLYPIGLGLYALSA